MQPADGLVTRIHDFPQLQAAGLGTKAKKKPGRVRPILPDLPKCWPGWLRQDCLGWPRGTLCNFQGHLGTETLWVSLENPGVHNVGHSFLGEHSTVSLWRGGNGLATHPFVTLSLGAVPMPRAAPERLMNQASRVLFSVPLVLSCCVTSHLSLHSSVPVSTMFPCQANWEC